MISKLKTKFSNLCITLMVTYKIPMSLLWMGFGVIIAVIVGIVTGIVSAIM